ncbi:MAG: Ig-like domain-containing protein [Erythrobacter sp.]
MTFRTLTDDTNVPAPPEGSGWFFWARSLLTRCLIALTVCLGGFVAFAAPAHAQARFTCTGDLYQVQSGQLRIFDTATSTYTNVGQRSSSYNSLAYNPNDDFFYATRSDGIIRVDANGVVTDMFAIGFNSYIGDIDDANNMYLRRSNNIVIRVNLTTQQQTQIPLSQSLASGAADWAFVDTPLGQRLIAPGRTQLSLIDVNTGENVVRSIADYPNEGSSGATWSDVNGRVFTFRNTTGNVYEILDYLTPNPRAVLVAIGDPSNSNDGSSCRRMPFPNFPPVAYDDAFSTAFQTALIDVNVIAGSGNGVDNDPDGTPITVTTDLISPPSNGSVEIDVDGSFIYTPEPGFSGEDTFIYEIEDQSGLVAQATVTITVTRPRLKVRKQSIVHQQSAGSTFFLPGHDVIYDIEISNTGDQEVDQDTLVIIDQWPADVRFYFGDLDTGGSAEFMETDPVAWRDNGSGLNFSFARDVRFSSSDTKPSSIDQCGYEPQSGYDPNVRFICIMPQGALQPSGSANFYMRGRIQ